MRRVDVIDKLQEARELRELGFVVDRQDLEVNGR
jgi:hypothetical protein